MSEENTELVEYKSTPEKIARLEELQQVIDENIKGFIRVGAALYEIKETKIYRETHPTFEGFCKDIWDMSRNYAHRLVEAKKVSDNLLPIGNKFNEIPPGYLCDGDSQMPDLDSIRNVDSFADLENLTIGVIQNEAQARPLTILTSAEQRLVWIEVLRISHEHKVKITASLIETEVRKFKNQKIEEGKKDFKKRIARDTVVSMDFKQGFNVFLEHVEMAKENGWNDTTKEATLKYLDEARALIVAS
jgi:hypothetical protein